jgi:chorismate-pyruvate lyase
MGHTEAFDPIDLSSARYARPGESTAVNLRALTPFQRALLVFDGTVTKFIEAYTLEPVEIERIKESHGPATEENPWLDVDRGAGVGHREVVIEGKYTRTLYVYAVSLVALERLPDRVRERLEVQGEGLGRLLNEAEIETRREVLWYARESVTDLPAAVRDRVDGEFVTRAYRIIADRRPIALITERFPCALGRLFSSD